ncbi:RNase adapter RapZ [Dietzia sp.]|uniref:RNase adapter RapZ n=1 Tax=Dietzia sp. TaxID=1871616 RepID=UPI002FD99F6D
MEGTQVEGTVQTNFPVDAGFLPDQEFLIVTGMSGAGKNAATKVLEEFGWYVVDNPPIEAIPALAQVSTHRGQELKRLAVVLDVRTLGLINHLDEVYRFVDELGDQARILFLDASEDVLVKRFNSVRRRHPLQTGDGIVDGINKERSILTGLHTRADVLVDTSSLSVHDLRRRLEIPFGNPEFGFQIIVESFGFKYGVPRDVDFQLDMRFLPNPYWEPELRELNGRDKKVANFVLSKANVEAYIESARTMARIAMDGYRHEGKRYMILGVGCTGGKHRSVAVAEHLGASLGSLENAEVTVVHRDLGRE